VREHRELEREREGGRDGITGKREKRWRRRKKNIPLGLCEVFYAAVNFAPKRNGRSVSANTMRASLDVLFSQNAEENARKRERKREREMGIDFLPSFQHYQPTRVKERLQISQT
jgi:hypothetical protein